MPSASAKSEKTGPVEPTDAVKNVSTIIEKKVRNLEKRKGKLESYKEKLDGGEDLKPDQKEALSKYGEVLQGLELLRELNKQVLGMSGDIDKAWKKKQRKESQEKQAQEQKRVAGILTIQNVLDSMGTEDVREDFKLGKKGAVRLTDENLKQLDELYKLVSPSRDEEKSFEEQTTTAAEHLINILDRKDKEVIGTTYLALAEVLDKIVECGYLDKSG